MTVLNHCLKFHLVFQSIRAFAQVRPAQKPLHELGMHNSACAQCTYASQVCTKVCMLLRILGLYVKSHKLACLVWQILILRNLRAEFLFGWFLCFATCS